MRRIFPEDGLVGSKAKFGEIDSVEQMLTLTQEDRRYGQVHFVDETRSQVMTYDGDASADSDVFALGRFFCFLQSRRRPVGDEVERGAALHGERRPRVMCEHKNGRMVRGVATHQPFQESSFQGPRTGPNILRPKIQAPTFSKD